VQSAPPSRRLIEASLLESIGEREDILLLRTLARSFKKDTSASKIGATLSRRLAPRVHVEDQGRVRLRVGSEWIEGSAVRRKVLALTCFLLSRPSFSAAKDQVLEALWPDLEPDVAANSLNQTVYFLRRVFEPDYKDHLSAGYVHHESDLVRLDTELVSSQSAHCASLLRSMSEQLEPQQVQELASEYRGKFALDFLYEEWAIAYRNSLHAQYVELVERSARRDESIGQFSRSIELLCRALEVDPDADQLEAHLVHLYRLIGANAAAAERYGHYASVLRRDLGVEPPGLETM
jgi:DNA-binding SARP family transcriptional activator